MGKNPLLDSFMELIKFYKGRICLVSSFGAESVILLDLVSKIDKTIPVIFIDTLKHFTETLSYRDYLIDFYGFTDIRIVKPSKDDLEEHEKNGSPLNDHCCHIRKVKPLDKALESFDAWISGRKRFHDGRENVNLVEDIRGKTVISPLVDWSEDQIRGKLELLPKHPMYDQGYKSIGCAPCTLKSTCTVRSGRWNGEKTECGIFNRSSA